MPNSKWEGNIGGQHLIMDFYSKGRVELYDTDHNWAGSGLYERKGNRIEFGAVSIRIKGRYGYDYHHLESATINKKRMSVRSECDGDIDYNTFRKI